MCYPDFTASKFMAVFINMKRKKGKRKKKKVHSPYDLFLFSKKIIPRYYSSSTYKLSYFIGCRCLNLEFWGP